MNEIGSIIGRMGEVSTAISAAVEQQSATTREIAASIEGVAGSTAQAAQAMGHVVEVADRAGDTSRNILADAGQVGTEATKLRREVEAFLVAVQTDSGERRRFERIAGNGVVATLTMPGAAPVKAVIHDLSRNGRGAASCRPGPARPRCRSRSAGRRRQGNGPCHPNLGRCRRDRLQRDAGDAGAYRPGAGQPGRRPRRRLTRPACGRFPIALSIPLPGQRSIAVKLLTFRRPDGTESWGILKNEGVIDLATELRGSGTPSGR